MADDVADVMEMSWRTQVDLRETAVEKLLEVCGEHELMRLLGWGKVALRPLRKRVEGLLALEVTLNSTTFERLAGEGRKPWEMRPVDVEGCP